MSIKQGLKAVFQSSYSEVQMRIYFIGLQGVLAFLFITPFAVMRFVNAEILKGLIDMAIVVGLFGISIYVVYGSGKRFANQLSYFFAATYTIGATAAVYFGDIYTVMWIFPTAICSYFILSVKHSVIATVLMLLVNLVTSADKFTEIQLFVIVTSYISTCLLSFILSIQIIHDRKTIENYAFYDVLTGAKTRNLLVKELQEAIEQKTSPLSIIAFDIDHFKRINDTKGHSIGDHTLKQVTRTVNNQLTPEQNIYRYGGEEFFILVELEAEQALRLAEKARIAVEKSEGLAGIKVTISSGIAEHKEDENLEDLTKRADEALYKSKESGRNCSTIAV